MKRFIHNFFAPISCKDPLMILRSTQKNHGREPAACGIAILMGIILFAGSVVYAQSPQAPPSPQAIPTPLPATLPTLPSLTPDSPSLTFPLKIGGGFGIVATPSSPSPRQPLHIQARTPTFDKNAAEFIWTVNGMRKNDLSGLGKYTFSMTAGEVGSSIKVSVEARTIDGEVFNASETIYVTDLALTWTTDTYVPKWYKGKALPVAGSSMRIVAVPLFIVDGAAVPPEKLIYTWSLNGNNLLSGLGQRTVTVSQSLLPKTSQLIKVVIEDLHKKVRKEQRVAISPRQPRAVVYQVLPLGGIEYRKGISLFSSAARGITDFQVEPFFFSTQARQDVTYRWTVGGKEIIGTPQHPYLLTVDTQEEPPGDVFISVRIDDANTFVPPVTTSVTIPGSENLTGE